MKIKVLLLLMLGAFPFTAFGQTFDNPTQVVFDPSPDHNGGFNDPSGNPIKAITSYRLTWQPKAGGGVPIVKDLGKPTPNVNDKIVVVIPEFQTLPVNIIYIAFVVAVNPDGTSPASGMSNDFRRCITVGCVAPPTTPGMPRAPGHLEAR